MSNPNDRVILQCDPTKQEKQVFTFFSFQDAFSDHGKSLELFGEVRYFDIRDISSSGGGISQYDGCHQYQVGITSWLLFHRAPKAIPPRQNGFVRSPGFDGTRYKSLWH